MQEVIPVDVSCKCIPNVYLFTEIKMGLKKEKEEKICPSSVRDGRKFLVTVVREYLIRNMIEPITNR